MKKIFNLFKKKKLIKIPLVKNGIETGLWVECYKGDNTYDKLVKIYGLPLPKTIETVPLKKEDI
jgi:hypothetical protein